MISLILVFCMLTPIPASRDFQYTHGWIYCSEWDQVVKLPDSLDYSYYSIPEDIWSIVVDDASPFEGWKVEPPVMIAFANEDDNYIGILHFGSGKLFFIGHMEKSAELFFEFLKPYIDTYIRSELHKQEN